VASDIVAIKSWGTSFVTDLKVVDSAARAEAEAGGETMVRSVLESLESFDQRPSHGDD